MLRSALLRSTVLSLLACLASCGEDKAPPPEAAAPPPPPVAVYVPPPLPDAPAAPWCARPAEATAFSVAALKSHLMVAALNCRVEEKYNAFISQFRPALVQQEKTTESYFSRNDKRHWQQTRDDYITQLANAQSQRATTLGDKFCDLTLTRFDEVMALSKPEELPGFAETKQESIPQPMKFSACEAAPPAAAKQDSAKSKKSNK